MSRIAGIYSTTVGKKMLLASTGIILFLYVVAHLIGNLQIFMGEKRLDAYAAFLHSQPLLLWGARTVLLFCVLVHIVASVQLWLRNRAARPQSYRMFRPPEVDYASRTMVWSGPIIALFVVYHILHFTTGQAHPDFRELAPYHNVTTAFSIWWVAGIYMFANLLLAIHLYHGLWSLFQSLGWDSQKWGPWRRRFAAVMAIVIGAGNIGIPLAVLTGVVGR